MATPANHMTSRIDDRSLLTMLERQRKEDPIQATRRAIEFLEGIKDNSDFEIIKNPDGSSSVKSLRNPDAPQEDPVDAVLFCLRSKIRRNTKR